VLDGHRRSVTALAFSQTQNPTLLCSATAGDYLIQWNIDQLLLNTGTDIAVHRPTNLCALHEEGEHCS